MHDQKIVYRTLTVCTTIIEQSEQYFDSYEHPFSNNHRVEMFEFVYCL